MRADLAQVLVALGFEPLRDFDAIDDGAGGALLVWKSAQPQPSEATIEAFVNPAGAIATRTAQAAKTAAAASIDRGATIDGDQRERIERALVLMILDEFNAHSTVEAAMFSAVAAATSLADLKTRYAAISQIPQRTAAQLVTAIKSAISSTPE